MQAAEMKDGPLSSLKKARARVKGQQIETLEQRKVELQKRLETLSSEISRIDEKLKRLRGDEK
jgi:predicted nuclease with TOPRIM domain